MANKGRYDRFQNLKIDVDQLCIDGVPVDIESLTSNTFQTVAAAQAYQPTVAPAFVRTASHTSLQYGGGAVYRLVGSEPTHIGKLSLTLLLGGVVWYEIVDDGMLNVNCYGALSDNTTLLDGTNNTAFIQGMLDHVGYYTLAGGRYKITDKLTIGSNSIGARFSGIGKEKSALVAVGMAGKSMVGPAVDTGLYRVKFADHRMFGDADICIEFNLASGQLYQSTFVELNLASNARPSFYATRHFATSWSGCVFSSISDHSIEIQGGNSTLLTNCYALNCGDGKAGFRIWTNATMISCVGLNQVTGAIYWGWFGVALTSIYQIEIIGGNAEDFGTAAINLDFSGQINIANFAMVARATGTYETFIRVNSGSSHIIRIRHNTRTLTKGATRSGLANIQGTGAQVLVENNDDASDSGFNSFYHTTLALLFEVPVLQVRSGEFSKQDLQITRLKSLRESGFVSAAPTTITANAATYAMARPVNLLLTANTVATSLTNVTGGVDGQKLTLMIKDEFTTVRNLIGGAGRFQLLNAVDHVGVSGEVLEFVLSVSIWRQVSSQRQQQEAIPVAISDETTPITAGTNKVKLRMPFAMTLSSVRASLGTAQATGLIVTVDINENGVSILSTKLTIDNTEKTSTTAAVAAVISDTALADDAELTFDIDQVGDGTAIGLKVTLIGVRT